MHDGEQLAVPRVLRIFADVDLTVHRQSFVLQVCEPVLWTHILQTQRMITKVASPAPFVALATKIFPMHPMLGLQPELFGGHLPAQIELV